MGPSRQSISMLVRGEGGTGRFPSPVAGNVRSPLWRRADASAWFDEERRGSRGASAVPRQAGPGDTKTSLPFDLSGRDRYRASPFACRVEGP